MNERIRQLAEQAETKEVGYYFFDREKFAQLIVAECLAMCQHDTDDDDDQFDLGRAHQAKQTAELIKTHFGVEL